MSRFVRIIGVLALLPTLLFAQPRFLTEVPLWDPHAVKVEAVDGGASKPNYKVSDGDCEYFVSVGVDYLGELGVCRRRELQCLRMAAELGLTPKPAYVSDDASLIVMPFIEARAVEGTPDTLFACFRTLHQSEIEFPSRFCPFKTMREEFQLVKEPGEHSWEALFVKLEEIEAQVEPAELRPCHGDLHNGNILDDGERLWLIDWEYAAMGDPQLDLANYCANHFMTLAEARTFYRRYDPAASEASLRRFEQMQFVSLLRWAVWCVHMDELSDLDSPYAEWVDRYMELLKQFG